MQLFSNVFINCLKKVKHIELEPKWKLGHGASGGRADILVKNKKDKPLLILECKTFGKEFNKAWKDTLEDGGQLFSYAQQISETEFLFGRRRILFLRS